MPNSNSINPGSYLVVILCGPGEDLFPLVNTQDQQNPPTQPILSPQVYKPCLPVLNRPMIEYGLDWVDESGLSDILILAPESQRSSINTIIKSRKSSSSKLSSSSSSNLQIRLECIPDRQLKRDGTTGSLRFAVEAGLIRTAFIILPCDLYFQSHSSSLDHTRNKINPSTPIPSRSLLHLIERHRTDQNVLTAVFYQRSSSSLEPKDSPPLTLVTLDPRTSTLLDTKELNSELRLRTKLLNQFPTPVLTTSLLPTHIYLCSLLVTKILAGLVEGKMRSFKMDFIPWLAKSQWQPGLLQKHLKPGYQNTIKLPPDEQTRSKKKTTTNPNPIPHLNTISKSLRTPLMTSPSTPCLSRSYSYISMDETSMNQHTPLTLEPGQSQPGSFEAREDDHHRVKLGWKTEIVVWETVDGFVGRANSVSGYAEINRVALKIYEEDLKRKGIKSVGMGYGIDSCVSTTNVQMGERCSVKKSVVGKGSKIGKGAKVMNSVLMERITVGENSKIENCVVADGVRIGDRVQLKDCEVGAGTVVEDDVVCKGERITDSDL